MLTILILISFAICEGINEYRIKKLENKMIQLELELKYMKKGED